MQVEIPGQCGLYVSRIRVLVHRLAQLDHTTEFITTTILRVGKNKLCVVLCRHELRLRLRQIGDCEVQHKIPHETQCMGKK